MNIPTPSLEQLDILSVELYQTLYSELTEAQQDEVKYRMVQSAVAELDTLGGFKFSRIAELRPHDYKDMADLADTFGNRTLAERLLLGCTSNL